MTTMIKLCHQQPSLWHRGLAEDIEGLWEPWMRLVDELLENEQLVDTVYEAHQGERHPQSRIRGRMQTPAEVLLRLAIALSTRLMGPHFFISDPGKGGAEKAAVSGTPQLDAKSDESGEAGTGGRAEIIRKGKASKPNEFGKLVKIQEAGKPNRNSLCGVCRAAYRFDSVAVLDPGAPKEIAPALVLEDKSGGPGRRVESACSNEDTDCDVVASIPVLTACDVGSGWA
jgi:hypothetical protein